MCGTAFRCTERFASNRWRPAMSSCASSAHRVYPSTVGSAPRSIHGPSPMKARSKEPSTPESLPHDTLLAGGDVRLRFGPFTLWETQRRLERQGQAVRLGARSFDLLLHLVKRAGELVSKDELLASVWTGLVVEEGSVRVHMSLLRKALGKPEPGDGCREWIATIPQRGYRFNGRVVRGQPDDADRKSVV